jgi:Ca-activated chloride channel family protein
MEEAAMSGRIRIAQVAIAFLVLTTFTNQYVLGQGLLVDANPHGRIRLPRPMPRPQPEPIESSYKIKELQVQAKLTGQVAKVQVSQSFVNTGRRQMEVSFVFPLPYDGAIEELTLLVDGKEYPAKLLDAKEARRMYEETVRKNQDPALLEWMGTGLFKTSVFPVPPGAERTVTLEYSQLCRASEGLTDLLFPLSTAKFTSRPLEKLSFRVSIESEHPIKNIYSPSHGIEIKRADDEHAVVTYTGRDMVPTQDFRLFYDVGKELVGAKLLSFRPDSEDEGFFLLLATPEIKSETKSRVPKTVVFVVDRSGSMSGKKIEQAKEALKFVLNNLREGDLFNVVAYDSSVESFRPELEKYNDQTRSQALGFIEGIYAGGSTNIDAALGAALGQLKDDSRPNYVIFLTDGLPTVGERNEAKIVVNAKENNEVHARVFTFGVGYDVNSRLLDKLARGGRGVSRYVRPDDDIEDEVGKLYTQIQSPVLTDVSVSFELDDADDSKPVNRMYPKDVVDLFAGEQLVLVGRYRKPGDAKIVIEGKLGGETKRFDFPGKFAKHSGDDSFGFVEKLWAIRRIGEIIDELDLHGRNEELVEELVKLSTTHGVLTPYTSFLADENSSFRDLAGNTIEARRRLSELEVAEGARGVEQRYAKNVLQYAEQLGEVRDYGFVPAADAFRAGRGASGYGGGYGGGGLGGRPASGPALSRSRVLSTAPGGAEPAAAADDRLESLAVQHVGLKCFYHQNERWVDSKLSEEQEKNCIKIERYSDAFFDLVEKHGKEIAKYLAIDGPVVVEIDGQAYSF